MKKASIMLLMVLGLVVMTNGVFAATSAQASATANLVPQISISWVKDLKFGSVLHGGTGTVIIATDSGVSGTVTTITSSTKQAAEFLVTGGRLLGFSITKPAASIDIIYDGGGDATKKMTVDTWVTDPDGSGTLSDALSGVATIKVGATLTIEAADIAGEYSGTFDVSVAYN